MKTNRPEFPRRLFLFLPYYCGGTEGIRKCIPPDQKYLYIPSLPPFAFPASRLSTTDTRAVLLFWLGGLASWTGEKVFAFRLSAAAATLSSGGVKPPCHRSPMSFAVAAFAYGANAMGGGNGH
jgi:hypothetical protein